MRTVPHKSETTIFIALLFLFKHFLMKHFKNTNKVKKHSDHIDTHHLDCTATILRYWFHRTTIHRAILFLKHFKVN